MVWSWFGSSLNEKDRLMSVSAKKFVLLNGKRVILNWLEKSEFKYINPKSNQFDQRQTHNVRAMVTCL